MLKYFALCVALLSVAHAADNALKFKPELTKGEQKVEKTSEDNKTPKEPTKKPAFCHDLDCPEFKVVEAGKDWELREYEPTKWVQTTLTGVDYNSAQYTMFMRLFRYISGQNANKAKIPMTVPVLVRIIPGQGPACEDNFTMSFYVSGSADPPAADDKTISIVTETKLRAYTTGFGGFATKSKYIAKALEFGNKLKANKKVFDDSYFYTTGYDAPFKLFNRHNEVWFMAK